MTEKSRNILLVLAILSFVVGSCREILLPIYGSTHLALILTPSILVSMAAVYIRLCIIDPDAVSTILKETDKHGKTKKELNPKRFYNFMPLAAICSTLADFMIVISLIAGIILFLMAQIIHIIAFSGLIHLNPKILFLKNDKKFYNLINPIFWGGLAVFLYLVLIYDPLNPLSLFVIPYIAVLTLCAFISSHGLNYTARSLKFRTMLFLGSVSFLISDTILGYTIFNPSFFLANFLIGITYLSALLLLQHAVIFLKQD